MLISKYVEDSTFEKISELEKNMILYCVVITKTF